MCTAIGSSAACTVSPYVRDVSSNGMSALLPAPTEYDDSAPVDPASQSGAYGARFLKALPSAIAASCSESPALDRAAAALAATYSDTSATPAPVLLEWMLWTAGIPMPFAHYQATTWLGRQRSLPSPDKPIRQAAETVTTLDTPCIFGLAGIFPTFHPDAFAVIVARQALQLDRFGKQAPPGGTLTISGRARAALRNVRFYVDDGLGIRTGPVDLANDGRLRASIPMPAKLGRTFVSLRGEAAGCQPTATTTCWERPLARFPIDVGVPTPTQPDDLMRHPAPNPGDVATWPARIVLAYNAVRAEMRLPPLELDEALTSRAAQVASAPAVAPDMPRERLSEIESQTAGSRLAVYGQSESRFELLDEYARLQLQDPGTRRYVVDPKARYVGLAIRPAGDGTVFFRVVEYYGAPASTDHPKTGVRSPFESPPETATASSRLGRALE